MVRKVASASSATRTRATVTGCLRVVGGGGGIRTRDLGVMSATRFRLRYPASLRPLALGGERVFDWTGE